MRVRTANQWSNAFSITRSPVPIIDRRYCERGVALNSRLESFETKVLSQGENLGELESINRDLIAKAEFVDSPQRVVLDIDSTDILVYRPQEHSAYNGHFESTYYHPPLPFIREGHCLPDKLRAGSLGGGISPRTPGTVL